MSPLGMVWALGVVYGTIVRGSQSHSMPSRRYACHPNQP
jgi:hypothetical protein